MLKCIATFISVFCVAEINAGHCFNILIMTMKNTGTFTLNDLMINDTCKGGLKKHSRNYIIVKLQVCTQFYVIWYVIRLESFVNKYI